jgi:hypothetical protein
MKKKQWPYMGTTKYPNAAREYLEARGILEAAKLAGIVYVTPEEAKRLVGLPSDRELSDGLAIPLSGDGGAVRFLRDGAVPKIKHERNAKNSVYEGAFPPGSSYVWRRIRNDASIPLHIVEGPLKALACTWNDIPTIGINGVWGWSTEHKLIPDFQAYEWQGREVILCFDSDVIEKAQVRQALKRLGDELKGLGARVRVKLLPAPDDKNVGADDYLARRGAKNFLALRTKLLSAPEFFDWAAPEVVQELNKTLGFLMHQGRATVLSVREDPDYPGTTKVALSRVRDVELEYANQFFECTDGKGNVIHGLDPVSWTPQGSFWRRSRWQTNRSGTRRSSSDKWSSWLAPGAARRRWRRSSAPPHGRSPCGSSRTPATAAKAMAA